MSSQATCRNTWFDDARSTCKRLTGQPALLTPERSGIVRAACWRCKPDSSLSNGFLFPIRDRPVNRRYLSRAQRACCCRLTRLERLNRWRFVRLAFRNPFYPGRLEPLKMGARLYSCNARRGSNDRRLDFRFALVGLRPIRWWFRFRSAFGDRLYNRDAPQNLGWSQFGLFSNRRLRLRGWRFWLLCSYRLNRLFNRWSCEFRFCFTGSNR